MPLGSTVNNPICIEVAGPGIENIETTCPVCLGNLADKTVWVNPHPRCCKKVFHLDCIKNLIIRLPEKGQSTESSVKPTCPTCRKKIWLDHDAHVCPEEIWEETDIPEIFAALRKSQVRRNFKCRGFERIVTGSYLLRDGTEQPFHRDPEEEANVEFLSTLLPEERHRYFDTEQDWLDFAEYHGLEE